MNELLESKLDQHELISLSAEFQMSNTYYNLQPTRTVSHNVDHLLNFLTNMSSDNLIISIQQIEMPSETHHPASLDHRLKESVFNELKENSFENIKNDHHTYSEIIDKCIICMDNYNDTDALKILPCHHYFHKDCIKEWLLQYNHVCPICKTVCD